MDAKTRRILIFSTAYLPLIGGAELALKEITDRITGIDFDLITSSSDKSLLRKEKLGNVTVYRIGETVNFLLPKNFYPISAFLKAQKLYKEYGPYDAILALQASQGGGAAWLFKMFHSDTSFILNIQEGKRLESQGWLVNFFRNMIIKKADVIVAISNYLADYAKKINSKAKTFVIPNGVDLQKFKVESDPFNKIQDFDGELSRTGHPERSRTDEKFKIKEDERVIITVSRLVEKNGIADLVDAFNLLNSKFKIQNSKLLIVGNGPLEESLRLKISAIAALGEKSLKLEERVSIIGGVSHDQVPEYLARADVFVRPSLSEGLGTAFLEAMAYGVPVIGTPVGGIPDFLKDGETGLMTRISDPDDLACKIKTILEDEGLRKKLIENGRKLIEEKYDWNKIAEEYQTIFTFNL